MTLPGYPLPLQVVILVRGDTAEDTQHPLEWRIRPRSYCCSDDGHTCHVQDRLSLRVGQREERIKPSGAPALLLRVHAVQLTMAACAIIHHRASV